MLSKHFFTYFSEVLYEWSDWSPCSRACGVGQHTRHKLCRAHECNTDDVNLYNSNMMVYEHKPCNASCEFGEVRSIDIESWLSSNPDYAEDFKGLNFRIFKFYE